ncbi:DNA-3-methyladenine glycosylase family protein [Salirhabdus salicampi]|uniref:DNA-3-methyladenine glycosylase family protein n=1 Tax=Salirhabdus salicampi TaxID=476102 RepID=UPI0020C32FD1|nr:DNA-3-methyladenine glycosylase [Salirhabdus salicampi]MCP8617919.1 DNA-3-methyladenine glycosylase [Salirhabdus salicampi]
MWLYEYESDYIYDFDYTLLRLSLDPLHKLNRTERWVDVPLRLGSDKHVVRVEAKGTTSKPVFHIKGDSELHKGELVSVIFQLFQWDMDLSKVHAHFQETNLNSLFQSLPATPIVKDFDLYGALMKIIIHQQLNMKFAHTLSTRFVQKYGEKINGVWYYPEPERTATIPYEELRELQFSQRKAEYVIDTSKRIVDGKLDLQTLAGKRDDEVEQELTKIRGIGKWTAENWLLFALGRPNLLPAADIGIQNALKKLLQLDVKPKKDEIYKMGEQWAPYRSYASLTLWRSIES